jgi:glycosyltransferase involved in cell wall biosynthesis
VLHQYRSLIVANVHMEEEYSRHGLKQKTRVIHLPVANPGAAEDFFPTWPAEQCELLFLGRVELLKGGQHLLEALPQVQKLLQRRVRVTFAGDGPAMGWWQERAQQIMQQESNVEIRFTGWAGEEKRRELLRSTHLLVMPSVWPEPFGLAGVEAAFFGVPAAAFRAGGVTDWLVDDVNGRLAPANPPKAAELAQAIAGCLGDAATYDRLCRGAKSGAQKFSLEHHLTALNRSLEQAFSIK